MEPFYFRILTFLSACQATVHEDTRPVKNIFRRRMLCPDNRLQRASSAVMFNIAEESGRYSAKERLRFWRIANGSAMETACRPGLAEAQGDIASDVCAEHDALILGIVKQRASLRASPTT